MYDAPQIPRDEEMLGQVAEMDLALAKAMYQRALEAEDATEALNFSRCYQRMARSCRQSIGMLNKLRIERRREFRALKDAEHQRLRTAYAQIVAAAITMHELLIMAASLHRSGSEESMITIIREAYEALHSVSAAQSHREVSVEFGRRRQRLTRRVGEAVDRAVLLTAEEEQLVAHDRTAECPFEVAELERRLGLVAVGLGHGALQVVLSYFLHQPWQSEAAIEPSAKHFLPGRCCGGQQGLPGVFGRDRSPIAPDRGSPKRVLQLPNVARPGVGKQKVSCSSREFLLLEARLPGGLLVHSAEQMV